VIFPTKSRHFPHLALTAAAQPARVRLAPPAVGTLTPLQVPPP
jgi:hypothetical protein